MPIPFKTDSLDKIPEAARSLYEKKGDVYVLGVEGAKGADEIEGLELALARLKREREDLRKQSIGDDDRKELDRLKKEEQRIKDEKAAAEGRWEELRARQKADHDKEMDALRSQITQRDSVVAQLAIENALKDEIAKAGIKDEYRPAVTELLKAKGPKVVWDGDKPKGVFPDEVHGDQAIPDFVGKWAKTDAAKPFLPVGVKNGGGGSGGEGKGGTGFEGKKYDEMSIEEKAAFLERKYATT